ncbi:40S ribosomal protein S3 [Coemansia sp. RSA 2559]|nr:40S ribosomal protein S3 [Coemansia sp. RSA 2559]
MESGAKGCEVVVSGKLRAARAKAMKFSEGFMLHSGRPAQEFIDSAVRHVEMKQGVLGIKVKIMLDHDPTGRLGPKNPLPDVITILDNDGKDEVSVDAPSSESKIAAEPIAPAAEAAPVAAAPAEAF